MSKKQRLNNFPGKGPNAVWILLLFLGLGISYLFWYNSVNREVESISYSQFLTAIEQDLIQGVTIQDQQVQGKYRDGRLFTTYIVPSEQLWNKLQLHSIDTTVFPTEKQSWGSYLFLALFPLMLILLFYYLRQSQGQGGNSNRLFSVGKSKARFFSANSINVTFKDVAGAHEAKEDLKEVVDFLKNPKKYEALGAKIPRGVLLSGAPGNGKTLLAKAVAGEAHCPFFSISGSDFVEVFVGVGASRVRDLFAQARRHAPCIVFIDEIDAVGRQRGVGLGGGNDEREQTLNQLLTEMDGFSTEHGSVIVLAATNRADILDSALLRPGRFDRKVEVPFPDMHSRHEILQVHAAKVKLDSSVNLEKIARGTYGFSGASLENLINEAALLAARKNETQISVEHFEAARDKIMVGAERRTLFFTDEERRMTAYHEAGHSLLNVLLPKTDPFHKVTILARGSALGISWSMPVNDKVSQTKTQLESRIMVCYGGLIAEKLIFHDQTSGVSSDLEKASSIARAMVRHFGMSAVGPVVYPEDVAVSPLSVESIDKDVATILQRCYTEAERLITDNIEKLHTIANTLLEKETIHAAEMYELLGLPPREISSLRDEEVVSN